MILYRLYTNIPFPCSYMFNLSGGSVGRPTCPKWCEESLTELSCCTCNEVFSDVGTGAVIKDPLGISKTTCWGCKTMGIGITGASGIMQLVELAVGIMFVSLDMVPLEGIKVCSSIIGVPAVRQRKMHYS